jgi:hypothetical protein
MRVRRSTASPEQSCPAQQAKKLRRAATATLTDNIFNYKIAGAAVAVGTTTSGAAAIATYATRQNSNE